MAKRSQRSGKQSAAQTTADPSELNDTASAIEDVAVDEATGTPKSGETQASDTPQTTETGEGQSEPNEAPKTIQMLASKAIWDEAGERHEAGAVVDLPVEMAKKLSKAGKATAYNPLLQD